MSAYDFRCGWPPQNALNLSATVGARASPDRSKLRVLDPAEAAQLVRELLAAV